MTWNFCAWTPWIGYLPMKALFKSANIELPTCLWLNGRPNHKRIEAAFVSLSPESDDWVALSVLLPLLLPFLAAIWKPQSTLLQKVKRRQSLVTSLSAYIIYLTQTSKHKCEKCWNSTNKRTWSNRIITVSLCAKTRRRCRTMCLAWSRRSYERCTLDATHLGFVLFNAGWRHRVFGYPFSAVVLFMSLRYSRAPFHFENNVTNRKLWHYTHFLCRQISNDLYRFGFWALLRENCRKVCVVKQDVATWRTIGRFAIKLASEEE